LEHNKHIEEREAMKTTKKYSSRFFQITSAIALSIAGLTASAHAQAYPGEELGRPVEHLFSTQTTYTEGQGDVELSISGVQDRASTSRNTSIATRVEYGITDKLQAQISLPLDIADNSQGMTAQKGASRIEAGAMYSIIGDNSPVALSVGGDIEVPLSASNDVSGKMPHEGPLFKPSLMIGGGGESVEVQSSVQGEFGASDRALNYSVGALTSFGAVTPSLEFSSRAQENAHPEFYATPGVSYSISDNAQVGVGAGIGLNDASDDVRVMARFTYGIR